MKIAIIGQQDFGKAVLEAFLARGDTVAAVFCAPEKEGARPDALRAAAQERGIKVHQFKSLRAPEAIEAMKDADADIGIMAFVLQFAPQEFVNIPRHGTIQYHPSLLPKYRGPSSINWPIIKGETETGLTIFRPTDGLDEGAVDPAEEDADQPGRHAGLGLFRSPVPAWACRRCWKRPTRLSPASTRKPCRTNRRRAMRAGAAPPRPESTGPSPSTTSTT